MGIADMQNVLLELYVNSCRLRYVFEYVLFQLDGLIRAMSHVKRDIECLK